MSRPGHIDAHCHTASIRIAVPAPEVFAYLADGLKQGQWALGGQGKAHIGDNVFHGTSMIHGKDSYVRPHPDPERMTILYETGPAPDSLSPRALSRVVPGPVLGHDEQECVITLAVWRHASMTDEEWLALCETHNVEMYIIRNLLERGAR